MFRLFKNLKPMTWILVLVVMLVTAQSVCELYLPENMSNIINNGIYIDYEELYRFEEMEIPEGFDMSMDTSIAGYNSDTIPVFEMQDGFSTVDLKAAYHKSSGLPVGFEFQDIHVRDSKELFNDVLIPFVNGLMPYQDKNRTYSERSEQERAEIDFAVNRLIRRETVPVSGDVTMDTFLSLTSAKDEEVEEEGSLWDSPLIRSLFAACFMSMKHSEYGNILPIPIDAEGNRLAVDWMGRALEPEKVTYIEDEKTGRNQMLPDYELILCNKVLGYAYKYTDGKKWVTHRLGITEETAAYEAEQYNKKYNLTDKKSSEYSTFDKILDYLSIPPKSSEKARMAMTAEDMLMPDGETTQMSDWSYILTRGLYMLLLTFAACFTAVLAAMFTAVLAANFSAIIRSLVFRKVETFSLGEFDKFSTASLITRSTNDINQIQNVFLQILRTALAAPITIIGGMILSWQKNATMALCILLSIPVLIIGSFVSAKVVYPIFDLIQKKVDRLTLIMREGLTGIRVVRAFNRQEHEKERFRETNETLTKSAITVNRWTAIMAPLISVTMNCTVVFLVFLAAILIKNKDPNVDVGNMMAIMQYMALIMSALVMLAIVFVMFPRASISAQRINEVLDTEISVKDAEKPSTESVGKGVLEFKNVCFKYSDEAENYILENISFRTEMGKTTAIVGGTGSGKSTIVQLIPRFYDIQKGEILLDNQNIAEMKQEELRKHIGYVPQKSMLFTGTIRENMQFGKPDATDDEIWEALRIAQSDEFVRNKEGALDAEVSQGGQNFSGGQKQRLAIARAVVRKPEIYIFDDSFSALDFMTDRTLRGELKKVTTESAVIIVAQRIGTILDADNIIVLDEGKIVGEGKHEWLLKNCKMYRDIALSQMSKEELGL